MAKGKKKKTLSDAEIETRRLEDIARRKTEAADRLLEADQRTNEIIGDTVDDIQEEIPSTADAGFQKMMDDTEPGAKFWVYRETGGKRYQIGGFSSAEWPDRLETIASECGGGDFLVEVRDGGGQLVRRKTFSFDPHFYKKIEEPKGRADSEIATILTKMQEVQMAMAQQSRQEMMELFKIMLTNNKPSTLIQTAQDLNAMKSFMGREEKSMGPKEILDILRMGMELAGEHSGGDSGTLWKLGSKLIETLGAPMAEQVAKTMTAPGAMPKIAHEPRQTEEPRMSADVQKVRSHFFFQAYFPMILGAAKQNIDAKAYAEQALTYVPEAYDELVFSVVSREDAFEYCAGFSPEIRQFEAWFKDFLTAIRESYEEEGGAEAVPSSNGETQVPAGV